MISVIATRLTRGQDLKKSIQKAVHDNDIRAGSIASCVGCLSQLNIRLAGAESTLCTSEKLEIVSLMATLTPEHQHIHIAVAKRDGSVIGGHLLEGCIVDTTAELIIHTYHSLHFSRSYDQSTGYTELMVNRAEST